MTETEARPPDRQLPRWLGYLLIFGLYLTLRGYHSRDGDQAYRLPLLLHRQNSALFADDPFVRAFDRFNPHRGSLALLDFASRPCGLSAALFGLFALTFLATGLGLDRLARAVWPELGSRVGVVAIGLVLTAKAGNIGTNHLFEARLLDRLMAFALGWLALAEVIERPARGWWVAPGLIGLAALVHPSLGLQLALILGVGWIVWGFWASAKVTGWLVAPGLVVLALALLPGVTLNLGQEERLLQGLPLEDFRLLTVELQGPQHLVPHLWRLPQWLAWACYFVLAGMALRRARRSREDSAGPEARTRLALLLAVNLLGLAVASVAVERWHSLRVTLFQPFRMATLARGLALILVSGRVLGLWRGGRLIDRARAALLVAGLTGDWSLVVATWIDLGIAGVEAGPSRFIPKRARPVFEGFAGCALLGWGCSFLMKHDTESGHLPLGLALGIALLATWRRGRWLFRWNRRRLVCALIGVWAVPAAALVVPMALGPDYRDAMAWQVALIERCRFGAVPMDDVERLAVWCREHTPTSARFIGPPGPKTFRLWSLRSLAFNRAASPYHAEGLADWFTRFRDHVAFAGSPTAFVRAYQTDRHGLERRYQELSAAERAALAVRQGATHVVAAAPPRGTRSVPSGPLELLHAEGRYAVYRVRPPKEIALRAEGGTRPAR